MSVATHRMHVLHCMCFGFFILYRSESAEEGVTEESAIKVRVEEESVADPAEEGPPEEESVPDSVPATTDKAQLRVSDFVLTITNTACNFPISHILSFVWQTVV